MHEFATVNSPCFKGSLALLMIPWDCRLYFLLLRVAGGALFYYILPSLALSVTNNKL